MLMRRKVHLEIDFEFAGGAGGVADMEVHEQPATFRTRTVPRSHLVPKTASMSKKLSPFFSIAGIPCSFDV